jgi:hydrogenase expression/formation protein HypC
MCLAIPGRVLSVTSADLLWREGRVDFSGVVKEVNLACVPEAGPGNYVLVHAGMAISVVNEEEAQSVLAHFRLMGEPEQPREGP